MMRDLCRVTSRGRTEKEREMAWAVRALRPGGKMNSFFTVRGRHAAQIHSATLQVLVFSDLG